MQSRRSSSVPGQPSNPRQTARLSNAWRCRQCGDTVAQQDVASGEAELFGGQVRCRACCKRERLAKQRAKNLRVALVTSAVLGAGLIVLFPAQFAFILMMGALLGIVSGVLGFTLSGRFRLALVGGGLSTIALCATIMPTLGTPQKTQFDLECDSVLASLKEDDVFRAQQQIQSLETNLARDGSRTSQDPRTQRIQSLQSAVDTWFSDKYGPGMTQESREVLLALVSSLGMKTQDGKLRFSTIQLTDTDAKVTAHLDPTENSGGSIEQPQFSGVTGILNRIAATAPRSIRTIHLEVDEGDASSRREFNISREEWQNTSSSQRAQLLSDSVSK